ncbi:histidinol-phosphate transaminase [Achromobacter kerstersii]|uniref:Histidinol-phosphate aminotransferase n=1 Tax=Achromobacter kerstersii TaxID=1353890 RepID=A0A6S6Z9F7_9BURK|nr:histidinol-phosphate transaminase [Achromobacter kerstersii]CAB3663857.1 Histidinol-phosphate aminotransferase [Achromobacter kerstersii]
MTYSPNVPSHISSLKAYIPGLPIEDLARRLDMPVERIAKLASNENPLGASSFALAAARNVTMDLSLYPDNDASALVDALSQMLEVAAQQVVVGAGSESLLTMVAAAFLSPGRSAVYTQYSFQAFVNAVHRAGAVGIEVPSPDFTVHPEQLLAAIRPDTAVIYVANPGNPTGTRVSQRALAELLERVPSHILVVLDEAYVEYLPEQDGPNSLEFVSRYPNVVLTRTFSKAYGLAGLRVGYGVAQAEVAAMLRRLRAPFSVTAVAQAAAIAALADQDFLDRTVAVNAQGREQLYVGFDALGLRYLPSYANFVLVEVGDGGALAKRLEQHGLIVRPVGGYGLPAWLRVSIGSEQNNTRLLKALQEEVR